MKALFGSIVLVLFLTACNNNKPSEEKQADMIDTSSGNTAKANENPYEGLRELAFSMKPEQLNIQTSGDSTQVYGVIMDSGMPDFTTTIVAYLSGDASMYTSTGGGVIGGVQHENVRQAAKEFVTAANKSLHGATKTDSTPLPAKGHFNIYLLTN